MASSGKPADPLAQLLDLGHHAIVEPGARRTAMACSIRSDPTSLPVR